MAQIFSRAADAYLRVALLLAGAAVVGGLLLAGGLVRSDYLTRVGIAVAQPVPFSHRHHAGELGIDCRYCHDQVETAATAGYPPTHTCMTCHSQLWTNAEALAPVRQSFTEGRPLRWNRVHDLPDYVYFNHSIHIDRGVGCSECHGAVDTMNRVYQAETLHMSWCLDCHRNPAPHLRPPGQVFNLDWQPGSDHAAWAHRRMAELDIEPRNLDSCYICHR
jgi:Cytochrome c7 and related cytochrome c/Class III cytochrome C family